MAAKTYDGHTVGSGDRVFNFHDWKWGVVVGEGDGDGCLELVHDDGSRTAIDAQRLLTHVPMRSTW